MGSSFSLVTPKGLRIYKLAMSLLAHTLGPQHGPEAFGSIIMKNLAGQIALLTGASGGLGTYIAHALAAEGMNLALVACPGAGLEDLKEAVQKKGVRAIALVSDLREPAQRPYVVEQVTKELGDIDVLVNNAGVEFSSAYHELPEENIKDVLSVNLEAPMMLTRLVLPSMLQRARGHIVNISSLAGKSGPGFQEPYAATKAALVAFTSSLRGTYGGTGVSASVVCPGFIEVGIYARLKARTGCSAPFLLGTMPPEPVARAVVRAVQRDLPEVIVNRWPVRPLLALTALFPSLGAWIFTKIGAHEFFRRVVQAQKTQPGLNGTAPTPLQKAESKVVT